MTEQINLEEGIKLFKTHQGKYQVGKDQFTNKDNTLAVIYIHHGSTISMKTNRFQMQEIQADFF